MRSGPDECMDLASLHCEVRLGPATELSLFPYLIYYSAHAQLDVIFQLVLQSVVLTATCEPICAPQKPEASATTLLHTGVCVGSSLVQGWHQETFHGVRLSQARWAGSGSNHHCALLLIFLAAQLHTNTIASCIKHTPHTYLLMKHLSSEHGDQSSIPGVMQKARHNGLCLLIPALEMLRLVVLWSFPARQPNLLGEVQHRETLLQ